MADPLSRIDINRSTSTRSPTKQETGRATLIKDRDSRRNEYGLKEKNIATSSASFRSPDKGTSTEQTIWSTKKSKGMTPKKIYFLSDYLQGFNPSGAIETKALLAASSQKLAESVVAVGSDTERSYKRNQIEPHGLASKHNRNEPKKPVEEAREVSSRVDTARAEKITSLIEQKTKENDLNSYSRARTSRAGSSDKIQPPNEIKGATETEVDKRYLEIKKSEVKERISKLSEKLNAPREGVASSTDLKNETSYEPLSSEFRHVLPETDRKRTFENSQALDNENKKPVASDLLVKRSPYMRPTSESFVKQNDFRATFTKTENKENLLSTYGSRSPTAVLGSVQKREHDTISKPRTAINDYREDRDSLRTNKFYEVQSQRVVELENLLKAEREKNRQLQRHIDELKRKLEQNSRTVTAEHEKIFKEKDQKIFELADQISYLERSIRDAAEKSKFDQESAIKRVKTEYEFQIKNLTNLINSKDRKIAQLERDGKSSEKPVGQKTGTLQEQLHTQQETFLKLKNSLESKTEENEKLTRKLSDITSEANSMRNEIELLESEKLRIGSENRKLKERFSRSEASRFGP